ncbi:MAG: aminotransferase class I/II-fold pyridoxal phosphate-dependent enzyme [Lachnospiraceae bacterium]|nr:aminotransferase class I/II-fold pyridoxal phosphate-dependent enzyme [Agathobacter sp.]MDD6291054.1 aminotransferase class I/II-fold pyridoxal phosphate-dependent enzyme [Lachnospiraceae bacterium]
MNIETASRLTHFKTGIFAALDQKKEELLASGRKVYNLSVGTPDFPVAEHVQNALIDAARDPDKFHYTLRDIPELTAAVKDYYKRRFGVTVSEDEIVAMPGSQEGIAHIGMALCNPGDVVLLPNPGYPVFEVGAYLGGAELYFYNLKEENAFLPRFDEIPEEIARRAKYIMVSYPYNPVCAVAPPEFYDELIAFAQKYNIIVVHDNAYSDIIYDGVYGGSFLEHAHAKEIGVEAFSLSKSFNLTGARVSFFVGNKQIIDAIKLLRSQYDFGIFEPIQRAAIAALTGPLDGVKEQCRKYQARRDALCGGLRSIGWNVPDSKGTMFAWAHIPQGFSSSQEFCIELMEKTGVICTPGDAFGTQGEGYVRFALVLPVETIQELIKVIDQSGILKG